MKTTSYGAGQVLTRVHNEIRSKTGHMNKWLLSKSSRERSFFTYNSELSAHSSTYLLSWPHFLCLSKLKVPMKSPKFLSTKKRYVECDGPSVYHTKVRFSAMLLAEAEPSRIKTQLRYYLLKFLRFSCPNVQILSHVLTSNYSADLTTPWENRKTNLEQ